GDRVPRAPGPGYWAGRVWAPSAPGGLWAGEDGCVGRVGTEVGASVVVSGGRVVVGGCSDVGGVVGCAVGRGGGAGSGRVAGRGGGATGGRGGAGRYGGRLELAVPPIRPGPNPPCGPPGGPYGPCGPPPPPTGGAPATIGNRAEPPARGAGTRGRGPVPV